MHDLAYEVCQALGLLETFLGGVDDFGHEFQPVCRVSEGLRRVGIWSRSAHRPIGPERVELIHPFSRRNLDIIDALPGTSIPNQIGLV